MRVFYLLIYLSYAVGINNNNYSVNSHSQRCVSRGHRRTLLYYHGLVFMNAADFVIYSQDC